MNDATVRDGLPVLAVEVTDDSRPHWEALARGEFDVPWCSGCDKHVWPPRSHCVSCFAPVGGWRALSGQGTVYSFSILRKGAPGFEGVGEYVVAYVDLDGGPVVVSNIVGPDALEVEIGDRVGIVESGTTDGIGAARFARVAGEGARD